MDNVFNSWVCIKWLERRVGNIVFLTARHSIGIGGVNEHCLAYKSKSISFTMYFLCGGGKLAQSSGCNLLCYV